MKTDRSSRNIIRALGRGNAAQLEKRVRQELEKQGILPADKDDDVSYTNSSLVLGLLF